MDIIPDWDGTSTVTGKDVAWDRYAAANARIAALEKQVAERDADVKWYREGLEHINLNGDVLAQRIALSYLNGIGRKDIP